MESVLFAAGPPVAYLDALASKLFFEADAARLGAVVRKIGKVE